MNNIYAIDNIDLNNLSLNNPTSIKGSAHISKLKYNNDNLYIQFPKGKSKNGIIITGKSKYIDIMYNNDDLNIIEWFENLEETLQNIIYTKTNEWFDNTIEKNDIESAFLSSIRLYKSGTLYLLRVQIPTSIIDNLCYNENNELINYTLVNNTSEFIPLLEFSGIKFTSTTFQLVINIKQLLLIEPVKFDKCIINYNNNLSITNQDSKTNDQLTRTNTNIVEHSIDANTVNPIVNPLEGKPVNAISDVTHNDVHSDTDNEHKHSSNTTNNDDNNINNCMNQDDIDVEENNDTIYETKISDDPKKYNYK